MEKFADKIKIGDKLNMHCDGWKIVKFVRNGFNVEVVFEDGTEHNFSHSDKVFAISKENY